MTDHRSPGSGGRSKPANRYPPALRRLEQLAVVAQREGSTWSRRLTAARPRSRRRSAASAARKRLVTSSRRPRSRSHAGREITRHRSDHLPLRGVDRCLRRRPAPASTRSSGPDPGDAAGRQDARARRSGSGSRSAARARPHEIRPGSPRRAPSASCIARISTADRVLEQAPPSCPPIRAAHPTTSDAAVGRRDQLRERDPGARGRARAPPRRDPFRLLELGAVDARRVEVDPADAEARPRAGAAGRRASARCTRRRARSRSRSSPCPRRTPRAPRLPVGDAAIVSARCASTSSTESTRNTPRWPLASAGLSTAGKPTSSTATRGLRRRAQRARSAAAARPASASRRRIATLFVISVAVSSPIPGTPSASAMRPPPAPPLGLHRGDAVDLEIGDRRRGPLRSAKSSDPPMSASARPGRQGCGRRRRRGAPARGHA